MYLIIQMLKTITFNVPKDMIWFLFVTMHQENMSVNCIPPNKSFLYRRSGVYMSVPILLIFDAKHRLWVHVLVRTASARQF